MAILRTGFHPNREVDMPLSNNELEQPARFRPISSPHRKGTLDSLRVEKEAMTFSGLPERITHPIQLLDTLKRAAPELGIPRSAIWLLDKLMAYTSPKDWGQGTRPLVWPSNDCLRQSLDLTESGITSAIRHAVRLGLVVMKDSPTRQRYGKRDKTGHIILACSFGFDLSPLATRYEEFRAAAERHERIVHERAAACRRITIHRHKLAQILETADEQGLWSPPWDDLKSRQAALDVPRRFGHLTLDEAGHIADRLATIEADARALLDTALAEQGGKAATVDDSVPYEEKNTGAPVPDYGPKNNTTPSFLQKKDVEAQQEGGSGKACALPSTGRLEATVTLPGTRLPFRTPLPPPHQIVASCPALSAIVWQPEPTWPDLADACAGLCARYGIGKETWQHARAVLTPIGATLAFAVMTAKPAHEIRTTTGAYFAGMIEAHKRGELHLMPSLFKMRQRTERGESRPAVEDRRRQPSLPLGMHHAASFAAAVVQDAATMSQPHTRETEPRGRISWREMIRQR